MQAWADCVTGQEEHEVFDPPLPDAGKGGQRPCARQTETVVMFKDGKEEDKKIFLRGKRFENPAPTN